MASKSTYDLLHDKYFKSDITKSGTKYERLTSYVFKSLFESDCVIHDIKITGDSEVNHQIDVSIQKNDGPQKRTLIECKDFDISGAKIGLGIVRNFFGVVEDTRPDDSMIISCNGFTRDARKYGKAKGIKLAVLRNIEEADLEGRIKTIVLTFNVRTVSSPKVSIAIVDEAMQKRVSDELQAEGISGFGIHYTQPVFVETDAGTFQMNEFIQEKLNSHPRDTPGPVNLNLPVKTIVIGSREPIPIEGIILDFEVQHSEDEMIVNSKKIAELILDGFGESDFIICDSDFKRMNINEETGEITST